MTSCDVITILYHDCRESMVLVEPLFIMRTPPVGVVSSLNC